MEKHAKAKVQTEFLTSLETGEGRGQSVAGDTGGRWGVLLTRLSASGFGIVNHPTLVFLFQFLLPRHRAASGLPPSLRGHWAQLDKHPRVQDHFSNYFFLRRRGKKKRFPSFFLGWSTSVLPWSSLSPPAQAQPGLGTEGKTPLLPPAPWGLGCLGIFHFPQGRIFLSVQSQ